ncbi:MAG TPA: alpha-L-arabinofuranosidase [Verrucomicrobiae bacterium]|jgi:hypothetical protein
MSHPIVTRLGAVVLITIGLATATQIVSAQSNLSIYTDHLVNGFQDWSWAAHNFANPSPVHSGNNSISVSDVAWTAVSFEQAGFNNYQGGFDVSGYTNFSFWANGGSGGGQRLQVYVQYGLNGSSSSATYSLSALPVNAWQQYVIPFSALGIAGATNVNRFNIQLTGNGTTNLFYLDDIQLTTGSGPSLVQVTINATNRIRTADARWSGLNTAVWDSNLDTPQTTNLLSEIGAKILRFPGGSLSDEYHWGTGRSLNNTWQWGTFFTNFIHVATNVGAQALITVNYGTGTPAEAAAWVRSANITNHLAFKYWEIGNECYGTWETDSNAVPNDPYTYAVRAQQYFLAMKTVDPTIKIGVVTAPGEDAYATYTTHSAINPFTGLAHYGWTPVMLSTLKSLGITPDFIVNHRYAEYSTPNSAASSDCDALLLQSTPAWTGDAVDLRQQLNAYLGTAATNVEMLVTENNSEAGAQGRQSTSLVNALYYADSLGQLMLTEFNAYVWWDLRNGSDPTGSFDPSLYGWRNNGDIAMVGDVTNCYPPFYAAKLLQHFTAAGDAILAATSDYSLLSAYAARHANGSVSLLVINKNPVASLNTHLSVNGYQPGTNATLYFYGIPQDNAAQSGLGSPDIQLTNTWVSGANFNYSFPPYSLTLLTLLPVAPQIQNQPAAGSNLILQIQGQPDVRYILQTTTNLAGAHWISVQTNTLAANSWNVTNSPSATAPAQFWRAAWLP